MLRASGSYRLVFRRIGVIVVGVSRAVLIICIYRARVYHCRVATVDHRSNGRGTARRRAVGASERGGDRRKGWEGGVERETTELYVCAARAGARACVCVRRVEGQTWKNRFRSRYPFRKKTFSGKT